MLLTFILHFSQKICRLLTKKETKHAIFSKIRLILNREFILKPVNHRLISGNTNTLYVDNRSVLRHFSLWTLIYDVFLQYDFFYIVNKALALIDKKVDAETFLYEMQHMNK